MTQQTTKFQGMLLKDEPLRSDSTQATTGEELRRSTGNSVNNDAIGTKSKGRPIAEKYGYERNSRSFLITRNLGTWNARSMNQGKLEIVKMEMHPMEIEILGISELKWIGSGHFTSGIYEISYSGNQDIRRNGVAIILNKNIVKSVIGYLPKYDRMISILIQGRPTNVIIIQIYAPMTDAQELTVMKFDMDLQQLLDNEPRKDVILTIGDWNAKVDETEVSGIVGRLGLGKPNEAGEKLIEVCQENSLAITNTCFQLPKRRLYTWISLNGQHRNQIDYILCNRRWKSSIALAKIRLGADCSIHHELLLASFKIKLKRLNQTSTTARLNLQNIPSSYTVAVKIDLLSAN